MIIRVLRESWFISQSVSQPIILAFDGNFHIYKGRADEVDTVPQQGVTKLLKVTLQNCQASYAFKRSHIM